MTRKACKRKHRPLTAPRLPLVDNHYRDLALQLHVATSQIDSESGLSGFVKVLTIMSVALESDKRHCDESRRMINEGLQTLSEIIQNNKITEKQEQLLKELTLFLDDLIATRLTYRGLCLAKKAVKDL